MKTSSRKVMFVLIVVVVIIVAVILIVSQNRQPEINFLHDAFSAHEETAFSNLSKDFQSVVKSHCPNGEVSECFRDFVSADWGEITDIRFAIGSDANNTQLYHVFWNGLSSPVSVVLIIEKENGRSVINGWRGFIISEGEDADSLLLHGQRHDNELAG